MRPLKVEELQHALAIRSDIVKVDSDHIVPVRTILDSCCGLVVIDQDWTLVSDQDWT